MAHAGGACSAYFVRYEPDTKWLHVRSTTYLRSECDSIEAAIAKLHAGEQAVVTGNDMAELRRRIHPDG